MSKIKECSGTTVLEDMPVVVSSSIEKSSINSLKLLTDSSRVLTIWIIIEQELLFME